MTLPYLTPLDAADLRSVGVPEPWAFGVADKVRFYELDALNHVNNTAYLRWFETIRVRWFTEYGLSGYGPDDPTFVLRSVTCDYRAPLFLHDDYIVTARCASFRTTSFRKDYAVWVNGRLCTSGSAIVVITDKTGEKKLPISDAMKRVLQERDGATSAA